MNNTISKPAPSMAWSETVRYNQGKTSPALAAGMIGLLLAAGLAAGMGIWFLYNLQPVAEQSSSPFIANLDMADSKAIHIRSPKSDSLSLLRRANSGGLSAAGEQEDQPPEKHMQSWAVSKGPAAPALRSALKTKAPVKSSDSSKDSFDKMHWKDTRWAGGATSAKADASHQKEKTNGRPVFERVASFIAAPEFAATKALTQFKRSKFSGIPRDAGFGRLQGAAAQNPLRALGTGSPNQGAQHDAVPDGHHTTAAAPGSEGLAADGEGITFPQDGAASPSRDQTQSASQPQSGSGSSSGGGGGGCPSGSHDFNGQCVADGGAANSQAQGTMLDPSFCGNSCGGGQACFGICPSFASGACSNPHCEAVHAANETSRTCNVGETPVLSAAYCPAGLIIASGCPSCQSPDTQAGNCSGGACIPGQCKPADAAPACGGGGQAAWDMMSCHWICSGLTNCGQPLGNPPACPSGWTAQACGFGVCGAGYVCLSAGQQCPLVP